MGIRMEDPKAEATCQVDEITIGGVFTYSDSYYIKAEVEDEDDEMMIVYVNLLDGSSIILARNTTVTPVELIMRKVTNK